MQLEIRRTSRRSLDTEITDGRYFNRQSNEPLKVRVNIGEGEFNGNIYLSDKENPNIRIVGNRATSNPNLHKIAVSEFKSGKQNFSISGNLSYKEIPSRVAVLELHIFLPSVILGTDIFCIRT
ncbi:hypothetical protein [Candidatus Villigracilis proximus]|uniref:hypothetical protein n=1 Tax=Candidatus Villigracilis proximus TaxID=3140683 RepID=UPI0031E732C8